MRKLRNSFVFLFLATCLCPSVSYGQVKKDTTRTFKNTIRINITNPLIFGEKYDVIGYERILKHNRSFSVNFGRFGLPKFNVNTDDLQLQKDFKDKGFNLAFDFRFYLRKENRYPAPRGIYIGPYYSYVYFDRKNTWSMNTSQFTGDVNTDLRIDLNLIGAQLGYQFVIKKRISLDLILMGPGIWFYNIKTSVNTTLNAEDEALLFEKINEILASKLPGHEILIGSGDINTSGSSSSAFPGFRYLIHLGFRF